MRVPTGASATTAVSEPSGTCEWALAQVSWLEVDHLELQRRAQLGRQARGRGAAEGLHGALDAALLVGRELRRAREVDRAARGACARGRRRGSSGSWPSFAASTSAAIASALMTLPPLMPPPPGGPSTPLRAAASRRSRVAGRDVDAASCARASPPVSAATTGTRGRRAARARPPRCAGRPRAAPPAANISRRRPATACMTTREAPRSTMPSTSARHGGVGELAQRLPARRARRPGSMMCASPATPARGRPRAPARCTSPARATPARRRGSSEIASSPMRDHRLAASAQPEPLQQLADAVRGRARAGTRSSRPRPRRRARSRASARRRRACGLAGQHRLRRSRRACRSRSRAASGSIVDAGHRRRAR